MQEKILKSIWVHKTSETRHKRKFWFGENLHSA